MTRFIFTSLILMLLSICHDSSGQDLSIYRWENRLVLLLVEDEKEPALAKQLKAFKADSAGLKERKLLIMSSTPIKQNREFSDPQQEPDISGSIYKEYHRKGAFEFVLIGLDGGVKLRKQSVMSLKELYRIIDSMPMRAAEMRRKNH